MKKLEAKIVVKEHTPLDAELINKDFETFDVYLRREALISLQNIVKKRNLTGKFLSIVSKIPFTSGKEVLKNLEDLTEAIQNSNVIQKDIKRKENGEIECTIQMAPWFVGYFYLLGGISLPFIGHKLSEKEVVNMFRRLIKGYFDPERQPYEIIRMDLP